MSFTICASLGHNQRAPPHPSSAFPRPRDQASYWSWWITPLPFQPSGPWRSSTPLSPHSHSSLPSRPSPCLLSPSPFLPLPLIYPFSPCSAPSCPQPPSFSSSSSPQGSAGLASTQNPSITSTSDIIRTEESWEHSFPMILKWHQGHSGPGGWLAGWPTGWLDDWVTGWPWKKRPEAHNLAGLANVYVCTKTLICDYSTAILQNVLCMKW